MALAGFYAFRVMQKEGTLSGILKNPQATKEKAHTLIEVLGQHLAQHVQEPATRSMIQSLGHQLVDKIIDDQMGEPGEE